MSAFTLTRAGSLLASAGLATATMAMIPGAAMAATDCGVGDEISAGICEHSYLFAGDSEFTAPEGVTKVSAILIGAGGGAEFNADGAYGGGGGEVIYVDSISTVSPVALTVGAGGAADDGTEFEGNGGGSTSFGTNEAAGGSGGDSNPAVGGSSGSGYVGSDGYATTYTGAGGGADGSAPDCYTGVNASSCPGGPGVTASSVAGNATLFPDLLGEPEYGGGGMGIPDLAPGSVGTHAAGHGGDATTGASGDDGNDGAIIIRWAATALPDTGLSVQPWMIGAGVATVAAGALFASGVLRTRRRGRHSA